MMLSTLNPIIMIDRDFIGYEVQVVPEVDGSYAYAGEDREAVYNYAYALSRITGWPVIDQSQPLAGDNRVGRCLIGDITYNGEEQPTIHSDERVDHEEYEPSVDEHEEVAA